MLLTRGKVGEAATRAPTHLQQKGEDDYSKLSYVFAKVEGKSRRQTVRATKFQAQQVRICDLLSKSMVSTGDVGAKLHQIANM